MNRTAPLVWLGPPPPAPELFLLDWFQQYSGAISAVANIVVIPIWLAYAQALYSTYSRQRRPRLIINQVRGNGEDSRGMVSNMSKEAVHVECVLVGAIDAGHKNDDGDPARWHDLTHLFPGRSAGDHTGTDDEAEADGHVTPTLNGPMHSGGYRTLGHFGPMAREVLPRSGADRGRPTDLVIEVRVIGFYGPEDRPFGAARRFRLSIDSSGGRTVTPANVYTRHLTRRRDRRELVSQLQKFRGGKDGR